MEKFKLILSNFEGAEMFTREQLKKVMGGDGGSGSGDGKCTVSTNCTNGSVSCTGIKCSKTNTYVTCDGETTSC